MYYSKVLWGENTNGATNYIDSYSYSLLQNCIYLYSYSHSYVHCYKIASIRICMCTSVRVIELFLSEVIIIVICFIMGFRIVDIL